MKKKKFCHILFHIFMCDYFFSLISYHAKVKQKTQLLSLSHIHLLPFLVLLISPHKTKLKVHAIEHHYRVKSLKFKVFSLKPERESKPHQVFKKNESSMSFTGNIYGKLMLKISTYHLPLTIFTVWRM